MTALVVRRMMNHFLRVVPQASTGALAQDSLRDWDLVQRDFEWMIALGRSFQEIANQARRAETSVR